jgi:hypothetical protein
MHTHGAVVKRYISVINEWFLLPQVIGRGADTDSCGWMVRGRPEEEETAVPHGILENGLREEEEGCAQIFYEWRALFCKKGSAIGPFN